MDKTMAPQGTNRKVFLSIAKQFNLSIFRQTPVNKFGDGFYSVNTCALVRGFVYRASAAQ
jgi:hypothetical protein